MTYIKLEDVQKILRNYEAMDYPLIEMIGNEINSLPSINPEAMIEEMIEPHSLEAFRDLYYNGYVESLEELLQKFKS